MNEKHVLIVTYIATCAAFVYLYKRFIDDMPNLDELNPDQIYENVERMVRLEVEKQMTGETTLEPGRGFTPEGDSDVTT